MPCAPHRGRRENTSPHKRIYNGYALREIQKGLGIPVAGKFRNVYWQESITIMCSKKFTILWCRQNQVGEFGCDELLQENTFLYANNNYLKCILLGSSLIFHYYFIYYPPICIIINLVKNINNILN